MGNLSKLVNCPMVQNMDNGVVTDEPLPPTEYGPPYSLDFVAHLHAGCYSGSETPSLMEAVRRDADGARMIDALLHTQLAVHALGRTVRNQLD